MKKIIPSILIAIIVLQLFAPFTVGLNDKKIEVSKNIVSAATFAETYGTIPDNLRNTAKADCLNGPTLQELCAAARVAATDSTTTLFIYIMGKDYNGVDRYPIDLKIIDEDSKAVIFEESSTSFAESVISEDQGLTNVNDPQIGNKKQGYDGSLFTKKEIPGLVADKTYSFIIKITKNSAPQSGVADSYSNITLPGVKLATTPKTTIFSNAGTGQAVSETGSLPACALWMGNGTPMGCLAQALYYLLFRTTSFFFGLTGKVLDFTLMYSINDTSYRSDFVVQGWGMVRDFCNMFFIFVLLYVAFGTILNLHGVKTKEMIINVVIIGLLMNFSLFATRLIIDTSNILARVFYNQNTIAVGEATKDANGNVTSIKNGLGDFGEIRLSEAIVSKVDPQKLIIEASKIDSIQIKGAAGDEDKAHTAQGITTGSFIIIILLATAVNIVGIIAFLSCGIIFIARVIGLWLAMILVPLAFFSYTVPALQDMKMVGWKHWWPDTLKLAFLAPVFTFFMYVIVGFMKKGLDVVNASSMSGLNFVVAIVVPFVFIMILLMKAKEIATDMSGEIGQSITNGIKAVGGVALGGAAIGGAVLGRKIIGQGLARASRGDTLSQKFASGNIADMNWLQRTGGKIGAGIGINNIHDKIGDKLNEKQKEVGQVDHARHVMDETKKAAGLEGIEDTRLSGEDINKMKATFARTKQSENETQVKSGYNVRGEEVKLIDPNTGNEYSGVNNQGIVGAENFKKEMRSQVESDYRANNNIIGNTPLTPQQSKDIENELNNRLNASIKATIKVKVENDFEHEKKKSQEHVNPITRGFAGANKNSYDARKISDMKSDQRESGLTKGAVGLAAVLATAVRGGIKSSGLSNGGIKVEGDFMKDLGNTISDSLKSMKVNVDLGHVGEHKSSADAHGGDAHH